MDVLTPDPWSPDFVVKDAHPADLFVHLISKYAQKGDVAYHATNVDALMEEYSDVLASRYSREDISDAAYVACGIITELISRFSPTTTRDDAYERRVVLMCALISKNLALHVSSNALDVSSNYNQWDA